MFEMFKRWNIILFIITVLVIFIFHPYYTPLFARHGEFPSATGVEIYYPYIFWLVFVILMTAEFVFRYRKIANSELKVIRITNLYFYIIGIILITYKIFFSIGLRSISLQLLYLFIYYYFYNLIITQHNIQKIKKIVAFLFLLLFFPMLSSQNTSPDEYGADVYYLIPGETHTHKEVSFAPLITGIHSLFYKKIWATYYFHHSLFEEYNYKFRGTEVLKNISESVSYTISFLTFIVCLIFIVLHITTRGLKLPK